MRLGALALAAALAAPADDGLQVRIDDLRGTIRDQATRIETTQTRTERSVAMPSDVLFAFDSARVSRAGVAALRSVAAELPEGRVTVTGHTDSRGSRSYNRARNRRVEMRTSP